MVVINRHIPIGKVIKMKYNDKNGSEKSTLVTRRSGKNIIITSITIHNNGNKNSTPNNERDWLLNSGNTRIASWNECIGSDGSVVAIPWGEESYHSNTSNGNSTSYSIEICEKDFDKVYPLATKRIADLLFDNGLEVKDVTTHSRWSGKNCPSLLLPIWSKFIADISYELNLLKNPIDKIQELVSSTHEIGGIISTTGYWVKVIKGEITANPDYIKSLFENIVDKFNEVK